MRPRPAAPRAGTTTAVVTLSCFAVVDGRIAVLVVPGERVGSRVSLPSAPLTAAAPELTALGLARAGTGRAPAWMSPATALTDGTHGSGAVLTLSHVAVVPAGTAATGGHDWVPAAPAPTLGSRDAAALDAALLGLRERMDIAPIAFRLLPERFTLSELQATYELLLGRRLHKASFRRALAGAHLVEPIDDWRSEGRGRPAQLHRFAPRRRRGGRRPVRFDLIG